MKHSQEEITNALKVIQDTCNEQHAPYPCEQCPLSKNGDCVIQEQSPNVWKIRPAPPKWTAFE